MEIAVSSRLASVLIAIAFTGFISLSEITNTWHPIFLHEHGGMAPAVLGPWMDQGSSDPQRLPKSIWVAECSLLQ